LYKVCIVESAVSLTLPAKVISGTDTAQHLSAVPLWENVILRMDLEPDFCCVDPDPVKIARIRGVIDTAHHRSVVSSILPTNVR
jgi:hypothetical protein